MSLTMAQREALGRGFASPGPIYVQKADGTFVQVVDEEGNSVANPELPSGSIGTSEIASGAVTPEKMSTSAKTFTVQINLATVTTTGNTDGHILIGRAGTLTAAYFNGTDALAANDTNYITFTLRNIKADGSGSDEMLLASDANTTKATGGSALSAVTTRSLQISGTALNLAVSAQHRLRFRAAASGTLANTITNGVVTLVFTAA